MRLNVGCGNHYAEGWTNVDVDQTDEVTPDVVADLIAGLPFPDGEARQVYLGHVLEHLTAVQVPVAVRECLRVLRPGGVLCIVGPDCDRADEMLTAGELDEETHRLVVEGAGRWTHDVHQWRSTGTETRRLLAEDGLDGWPVQLFDLRPFWPLTSGVRWQFALQLRKEPA